MSTKEQDHTLERLSEKLGGTSLRVEDARPPFTAGTILVTREGRGSYGRYSIAPDGRIRAENRLASGHIAARLNEGE